jgi:tetratricopeptide (TPR) repeat protein
MADESAGPEGQAQWGGRLIGTLIEKARQVPVARRPEVWEQATRAADAFVATQPENPWVFLVQYQAAMAQVARAESTVLPAVLGFADSSVPRADLRTATKALAQLEDELEQRLRVNARGNAVQEIVGPMPGELKALRARVFEARGQVYLDQARLYKSGTPDQLNSCQSAIQYLEKISPADVTAEIWDDVQINSIVALRLKRDFAMAERKLDRLLEADGSTKFKLLARAERIRLALAQGQAGKSQAIVTLGREIEGRVDPELDIACLETMLHQWNRSREARQEDAAQSWRAKAVELVETIERDHSPFWLQRAETLLATAAASGSGADFDVLQRTAKNLYLRGQLDEAVNAYDQAADQAESNGDPNVAYQLAFRAAAIQEHRGLNDDAQQRFRVLASRFVSLPEAPRAHELAILKSASALQDARLSADEFQQRLNAYQELLIEHVTKWPDSESANRVRLWLAKLYERQHEFWLAAQTYCQIRDETADPIVIFQRAKSCYTQALEQATERELKLHTAVTALRELAADRPVDSQRPWADARRREARLMEAELQLRFSREMTASELDQMVRSLESLLNQQPDTGNPQWRDRVQALLVAAHARAQRWDAATRQLDGMQNAISKTWFELLAILAREDIAMDGSQRDLGQIQLVAVDRLMTYNEKRSPTDELQIARWRADALLRTGNFSEAQIVLRPLVNQHPDDFQLREVFAQSLLQSDDPAVLKQALEQWRFVLNNHPPHSSGWFRSKYALALIYHKLGQPKRTAEMIRLLAALHPDLGGGEMRRKFQELLAESERKP